MIYHCDMRDNYIRYINRGHPVDELPYNHFSTDGEALQEYTSNLEYIEDHGCTRQEEFERECKSGLI